MNLVIHAGRCRRILAASLLALGLAACNDDDPAQRTTIDSAGGVVENAGARVEVPAGALAAPTEVSVELTDAGAPAVPTGVTRLGATFMLEPHGVHFAQPVTVRFPFDPSSLPPGATIALLEGDGTNSGWVPVEGAHAEGNLIVGQVSQFSPFFAATAQTPVVTLPPLSQTVTAGGDVTFRVGAIGTPVLSFSWLRDGSALGAAVTSITLRNVQAGDDGARFSVVVSNAIGQATSVEAVLHVTSPMVVPTISGQPAAVTVAAGQDASFSVAAAGSAPLAYQWRIDGVAVNGATGSSFTVAGATLAQSGSVIDVMVSNAAGSLLSAGAALTVTSTTPTPGATLAPSRFAASDVSLVVLANGDVSGWGQAGAFGDPSVHADRLAPGPVPALHGIAGVAASGLFDLAVATNGDVYAWGYDGYGELGTGHGGPGVSVDTPQRLTTISGVAAVAAGASHSVFLKSDGTVWTAGANDLGQLGNGSTTDSGVPVAVPISGVIAVSTLAHHTLALKGDGTVWGWGANLNCQLGTSPGSSLCLNQTRPMQIAGVANAFRIAAGRDHSLALVRAHPADNFGNVWGWGLNDRGQLGLPVANELVKTARETIVTPAAEISAGASHSMLMHFDGTVFAFGDNRSAQLGDPGFSGAYSETMRWVSTLPRPASAIFAGASPDSPSLVALDDGSLWAWGINTYGQVGNGSESAVPVRSPTRVNGINLH